MGRKLIGALINICSLLIVHTAVAQKYDAIYSGVPWFDDKGNTVSAHGACIIKDNGRFYLFGERHSDTSNAFAGFNCYSSEDLYNWKFESIALPLQRYGKLGPNRVGERPKVMKCPKTGQYIMYMHVDSMNYKDQYVGYAVSDQITGPYEFKGPVLFNGSPIRMWDMGTFQDFDGAGYILIHGGGIFRLSEDYKTVTEQVNNYMTQGFESPAIFRKGDRYYFLGSGLTGWERNDNDYYTAASLSGPWRRRAFFCPFGSLTWNSQTTFVLPVYGTKDTTFMFMGDRWSYPYQHSAATYVWQPVTFSGANMSIPEFQEAWKINISTGTASRVTVTGTPIELNNKRLVSYSGNWRDDGTSAKLSDEKNATVKITFSGSQIALYGAAVPEGGYGRIEIRNLKGKPVLSSVIDFYCKYPAEGLRFLSPVLERDKYVLSLTVMGEHWKWVDKSNKISGSRGDRISVKKIIFK